MRTSFVMFLVSFVPFVLGGCTALQHDLPYMISIDTVDVGNVPVLSLHKAVLEATPSVGESNDSKGEKPWSIQSVQEKFEAVLLKAEQSIPYSNAEKENFHKSLFAPKVSSKQLIRYALGSVNPDQSLDRFDEFLSSTQWVKTLLESSKSEEREGHVSQWCGICPKEKQQLYRINTVPQNLHENLEALSKTIRNDPKQDQSILALGYEFPWDKSQTLIRYGVTFYFREEIGTSSPVTTTFLGTELIYANEATPKPFVRGEKQALVSPKEHASVTIRDVVGYPIAIIIGLKNAAFEIAKVPFSSIGGIISGRDNVLSYPRENVRNACTALKVELMTGTGGGDHLWSNAKDIWRPFHRLFTEIPLIGPIFLYSPNYDTHKEAVRSKLFLSRGIYGGDAWGQDTGLWAAFVEKAYPDYDIYSPPYRHGTAIDVLWSLLNLSNGPSYDEAAYVMNHANRDDTLFLSGHSGGVQRSVAASRILWDHGYPVTKVVGMAGPSIGRAYVDNRYPDSFRIYLNKSSGANEDIVSQSAWVLDGLAKVVDFGLRTVPRYVVLGGFCLSNNQCQIATNSFFDRRGLANAQIVYAESKPSTQHETPFRISMTERVVFDGYMRNAFSNIFRNDLHRKEVEDTTIPWSKTK